MNDLFAPPGNDWRPVSPQLGRMRRTVLTVVVGIALVALAAVSLVMDLEMLFTVTLTVVLLVLLGFGWVLIGRNVRSWGYAERDDDLYIKHGVMFRELIAVPYGRMQFVDINAGPIEQLYGVASVHLHTASTKTGARIPGLPKDEAARLRDRLTSLGETQAAGL